MSFTLSTGNVVNASASAAITSNTADKATITVTASAGMTNGWVQSTGVVAVITINGSSSTKTVFGNGTTYYASSGTKSVTYAVSVAKGTAAKSVSWSVKFYQYTDGTQESLKQTNSGTTSITAKTSYKISYNANGGSGAPSAQTKWYGTALTLATTKPTRTGYSFTKWNTASGGTGTSYASGASYTANAAATLYAQWTADTYTVSYNANGGSGAPSSQTKTYGVALKLSGTKPTRTNYNFLGWSTSASATTATYAAGGNYTDNSAVTLYAVWELAYTPPKITNLKAQRCTSNGTLNAEGTYYKLTFSWSCDQTTGSNAVSSITYAQKLTSASSYGTATGISASGTGDTVSIVAGGSCAAESSYDIRVTITDSKGGSTSVTTVLPTVNFLIDFLSDGTGVAVGKAATVSNAFDVYKTTIIRGNEDASGTYASGQLIVGDPDGIHIAMDNNEIMAKNNATSVGDLSINYDGGNVGIGGSGSIVMLKGDRISALTDIHMANAKHFYGVNTSGATRSLIQLNASNQVVFGYGGYSNNEGASYFDGNSVNIRSKGAVAITSPTAGLTARHYGVNKVLASGAQFMNGAQTWTFSEAVSAQPHGIVLVWSYYSANTAQNYNFITHFIPKHFVAAHNGCGMDFDGGNQTGSVRMNKYLYVKDTGLTGHDNNGTTNSGTAFTVNNANWVLRYVIGV